MNWSYIIKFSIKKINKGLCNGWINKIEPRNSISTRSRPNAAELFTVNKYNFDSLNYEKNKEKNGNAGTLPSSKHSHLKIEMFGNWPVTRMSRIRWICNHILLCRISKCITDRTTDTSRQKLFISDKHEHTVDSFPLPVSSLQLLACFLC